MWLINVVKSMNIQSSIVLFLFIINLIGIESHSLRSAIYLNKIPSDDNSDELGENFEGDIILNAEQDRVINGDGGVMRTGKINLMYRWNTTIPYELDPGFTTLQMANILSGMAKIESKTCLTFRLKNQQDVDYIYFNSDTKSCSSSVGRQKGENRINLNPNKPGFGCFKHGSILHEIIHTLGFFHMHSASDRDKFVEIIWENIIPGKAKNFQNFDESTTSGFGIPYDYESVMHYPPTAFATEGKYSLITLDPEAPQPGQRLKMSKTDIARINAMYCTIATTEPPPETESEPELEPEIEVDSTLRD